MRLSSMADYAVVTMSAAARHCGGGRTSAGDNREQYVVDGFFFMGLGGLLV
mgnify:CR=1 FL=1